MKKKKKSKLKTPGVNKSLFMKQKLLNWRREWNQTAFWVIRNGAASRLASGPDTSPPQRRHLGGLEPLFQLAWSLRTHYCLPWSALLLLNLCSLRIKCRWFLEASGLLPGSRRPLQIRSQSAPLHAHRSQSSGCWGFGCECCICCWRRKAARESARTLIQANMSARTGHRSGSIHPLPSYSAQKRQRGCEAPSVTWETQWGGPAQTRSEFAGSAGRWSAAFQ